MVWLGVDLGQARVGLALSDPGLILAHPAGNIAVKGDYFNAIDSVISLIEEHQVTHVVIGLPLMLDGSLGASAKKAQRWGHALQRKCEDLYSCGQLYVTQVPEIVWCDERLTTVTAHRQLFEAQVGSRNHRPVVDQQSAVVILQTMLDRNK